MSSPIRRPEPPSNPLQLAARVLVRVGVAMVVLCVLCRLVPDQTEASRVVNAMATVASLLVVVTGVIAGRVDQWRERRDARPDQPRSPSGQATS